MLNLTPNATARHWAVSYLNLPWFPGGEGPDHYDCWGLTRDTQLTRYGRDLPPLRIAAKDTPSDQWITLRKIVQRSPWQTTTKTPREGDVLLMVNARSEPHVGIVIELPRLSVLHSVGGLDGNGNPYGNVRIDAIDQLGLLGFGHLEVWRYGEEE